MKKVIKFFKNIIIICIILFVIIVGYITYDGYNLYKEVVAKESIEEKVESIKSDSNFLEFDEIPKDFWVALVSIEDHRFFKHYGFDMKSIGRAMITNIKEKRIVEGGSTITQQLAKNMYFSFNKKFSRKVAELFVALDLEKKYKKEEILSLYIDIIYFGDGYYGLKQAANGYYNKTPKDLNYDEITLLAGLPNAPSAFTPTENPDLAIKRQELVKEAIEKYKPVF